MGSIPAVMASAVDDGWARHRAASARARASSNSAAFVVSIGATRSGKYPELPTHAEAGFPQVDGKVWYGISAPPGVPRPVVARVSSELRKILDRADVRERFGQQGADATFLPPDRFVAFMKAEWAKWGPVVKATGARVD